MYKYQPSFYFIHKTFPIDDQLFFSSHHSIEQKRQDFCKIFHRKTEQKTFQGKQTFHNIDDANI